MWVFDGSGKFTNPKIGTIEDEVMQPVNVSDLGYIYIYIYAGEVKPN